MMNQQQQPHIPPHVVILADSSLALAAEWDQLVQEYLFPMLKSLAQSPAPGAGAKDNNHKVPSSPSYHSL